MIVIETPRLKLRRLTLDDARFVIALLNDDAWLRFIGDFSVRTEAEAHAYLTRGPLAMYARYGFGLYRVELAATGEPIGFCGLIKRDFLPDVDLGFAFLAPFRGQGYGCEAARACIDYAAGPLGLPRLLAISNPANAASLGLLAKLGFTFERELSLQPGAPAVRVLTRPLVTSPSG